MNTTQDTFEAICERQLTANFGDMPYQILNKYYSPNLKENVVEIESQAKLFKAFFNRHGFITALIEIEGLKK